MNSELATSLGDYQIRREAGRGAMSTVYEAEDTRDGRTVALKVLQAPATLPPEQQRSLIARLQREARIIARLSHPNIVRILEVGEADGRHYLAMEYLQGTTLRARLDAGVLPLAEASLVLDQVAAALDAIHAQRIVHRDIKPSNVMLLPDGVVKLMDFGIARRGDDTTITQAGMIVGSPAYMSPEQIRGDGDAPPADLWALGILLYEMLSGRSPWVGNNIPSVLYQVTHDPPAPIAGIPAEVQKVLRRALDKNPARRFPTARQFADAFRAAALPAPVPYAPRRRTTRVLWPALGLLAVFLAAFLLTHWLGRTKTPPPVGIPAAANVPALRRLPGLPDTPDVGPVPAVTIRERPLVPRRRPFRAADPRRHKSAAKVAAYEAHLAAVKRHRAARRLAAQRARHFSRVTVRRRHASRSRLLRRHFVPFRPSPRYDWHTPVHPVYNPQGPA